MKVIGLKIVVVTSATFDIGCLRAEEEEEEGEEEEEDAFGYWESIVG